MNGILVVNHFISGRKFSELYSMLQSAAHRLGITLELKRSGEFLHNLEYVRQARCDFVLFWDKDVVLAKLFEQCGRPVFNTSEAIFHCDNKAYTAVILQNEGIPTPATFVAPLGFEGVGYCRRDFLDAAAEKTGYPLVLKELYGSFGQQVHLIHSREALFSAVDQLGYKGFLIQQFISASAGRDVRINVVGERVVSSMLRYRTDGEFRSNISNGGHMRPYEAGPEQRELALRACRALKLDFAGVDVLFGHDGSPMICEVNSNPHFKSSLECTGVDMSVEILQYIQGKMQKL